MDEQNTRKIKARKTDMSLESKKKKEKNTEAERSKKKRTGARGQEEKQPTQQESCMLQNDRCPTGSVIGTTFSCSRPDRIFTTEPPFPGYTQTSRHTNPESDGEK